MMVQVFTGSVCQKEAGVVNMQAAALFWQGEEDTSTILHAPVSATRRWRTLARRSPPGLLQKLFSCFL
jgi:nitrogenase molybdenum-iron protein alpha/beta subunit